MDATIPDMARSQSPTQKQRERLSSTSVRRLLLGFVKGRVPADEAEDVVQTVLCAALAAAEIDSARLPEQDEELRRWLIGVARHKIADYHRSRGRAPTVELDEQLAPSESTSPDSNSLEAQQLALWAQEQAPDEPGAKRTLEWMAREGAGDKLAHIAQQEQLPATQVRQRVSRMRRFLRRRWAAELAAVAGLLGAVLIGWFVLRRPEPTVVAIRPDPGWADAGGIYGPLADPLRRAVVMRDEAFAACDDSLWNQCLDRLDKAAGLDPAGDKVPKVRSWRKKARRALDKALPDGGTDAGPKTLEDAAPSPVTTSKPPAPKQPPTATSTATVSPPRPTATGLYPSIPDPSKSGPSSPSSTSSEAYAPSMPWSYSTKPSKPKSKK